MAVSDFLADLGVNATSLSSGSNFIKVTLIFLLAIGLTLGVLFWIINRRQYVLHIHVWEDINGLPAPKIDDIAKEISLPNTSTRAIYLKKQKIFLPRPSLQFGKNHYLYYLRSDGEWLNVLPKSINTKLKEMDLWFDHSDMRLANASLKKLVEKNYKKLNWLKEWAPYIGFGIIILLLGVAGYLVVNEAGTVSGGLADTGEKMERGAQSMGNAAESFERVAERMDRILAKMDT